MAIVTTRYRDISIEEVESIHKGMPGDSLRWELMRGKPLSINVPAVPGDTDGCGGPWFLVQDGPVKAKYVCPHLAEIGD